MTYMGSKFHRPKREKCIYLTILLCGAAYLYWICNPRPSPVTRYAHNTDGVFVLDDVKYNSEDIYNANYKVAIVCAITTKGFADTFSNKTNGFQKLPLFVDLLPSVCETASSDISYTMYLAFDSDDPLLQYKNVLNSFKNTANDIKTKYCNNIRLQIAYVKCNSSHKPAKSQNTAMMFAHQQGNDYLFRLNDDTIIKTKHWTEQMIATLLSLNPPNVGVVGPSVSMDIFKAGNPLILTYEFIHRTHIDIFGYHYPSLFTTWFADDWISRVYQPERAIRLTQVQLKHTETFGIRYTPSDEVLTLLDEEIEKGRDKIFNRIYHSNNTNRFISKINQ